MKRLITAATLDRVETVLAAAPLLSIVVRNVFS